jgi:hypothetical protein
VLYALFLTLLFCQATTCSSNTKCASAEAIDNIPSFQNGIIYPSLPRTTDNSAYACSQLPNPYDGSGHWYQIDGNDMCLAARVTSMFSFFLAVYEGSDCSSLSCVAQESYSDGRVEWIASAGTTYSIFVGGMSSYDKGDYTLSILVRTADKKKKNIAPL